MNIEDLFKNLSFSRFLEEIDAQKFTWVVKRLSGNDTGLTGGHQAGVYYPRDFFEVALPEICTTERRNPDLMIEECYFPAQDYHLKGPHATYYNTKYFPELERKKPHDEFRLTAWGGSKSPVQDPENTGSIFIFALVRHDGGISSVAWVVTTLEEEVLAEGWLGGEVEPGQAYIKGVTEPASPLTGITLPPEWYRDFPSGKDIFELVVKTLPRAEHKGPIDNLLLARRKLEFKMFEIIERAEVQPKITQGFDTVDEFISLAHSVSNRRKSRTGKSLELNLESIFCDEKIRFDTQVITENRKKPDFIFPSGDAYHDPAYPETRLNMLAAKTCCKDRWRQMLNEADRIPVKHLFTLQEGISGNQLKEMKDNGVQLVVPKNNKGKFPKDWRKTIRTLDEFVSFIKSRQI
jgi:type II restriction enzyme